MKRNPLKTMIREVDKTRQNIRKAFNDRTCRQLIVSNPILPEMYALPKKHKPGRKMRPIVSNINAPSYKMAKWLVSEMKRLPKLDSCSVKNSIEFVEKISNCMLNENEVMTSFDVSSLFPSIPVDIALKKLDEHLNKCNVEQMKRAVYMEVATLCMKQSYFQFREDIYKVEFGTNMGHPLSPLIAELFMSAFEMDLKSCGLLPRVWHRYVDDVFAIVEKNEIQNVLTMLNSKYNSIKFTFETEIDGKLPFLDLLLQRTNNKIEIGVYHKPTTTMRTITSDSHCHIQHKLAAYHCMVYRLCRLPLSIANYMKEHAYIHETARVNGYGSQIVDKLIYKHARKVNNSNLTTLFSQVEREQRQRVAMNFVPEITNRLKTKFNEYEMDIVYRNDNKISNLLGSTKNKKPPLSKSGVYVYECDECQRKYYGQTKRSIECRFKEHCACIRLNHPYKSAIAAHALVDGHENVSIQNLKLLKQVRDDRRLDVYEAIYIQSDANTLNQDRGNVESNLFALI